MSSSFLSTASNLLALYSRPVISKLFISVSVIDITRKSLDSSFVLPVCKAALERVHIASAVGEAENALATLKLLGPFTESSV